MYLRYIHASSLLLYDRMTSILVIARYNEDINWIREFPDKIIYNKGSRETIPEDLQSYSIELPNVGREAHTILHYIIENYDTLPDVVVFSQGRYDDQISLDTLRNLFLIDKNTYSSNFTDSRSWGIYLSSYNFRIKEFKGTIIPTKYNESYGQWYERIFREPFPHDKYQVYCGAFFSVGSNIIRKYPKEYYINIMENGDLKESSAPEAAHFMERTWSKMFTPY